MGETIKKLFLKIGLKQAATLFPPRFSREYKQDVIKNTKVHFSYLKSEDRKYKVELGELYCLCGGKIEKNFVYKEKRKGKIISYRCDIERKNINVNESQIKKEILKNIRNRYPEEVEYLMQ